MTVLIIGGGASGMVAAITARRLGAQVTILEKNPRLGKNYWPQEMGAVT